MDDGRQSDHEEVVNACEDSSIIMLAELVAYIGSGRVAL